MTDRISAKAENALHEAIREVTQIEAGQIPPSVAALDEQERTEVGALAVLVTAYVLIEACGAQWPVRSSVQKIAKDLATGTSLAERQQLDPEQIHAYLSRTVFGRERLEEVIPDEPAFARLPIIVAGEALAVYSKGYSGMWDYLDRVESGIEAAARLDPMVLPGVVMRAYMAKPQSSVE